MQHRVLRNYLVRRDTKKIKFVSHNLSGGRGGEGARQDHPSAETVAFTYCFTANFAVHFANANTAQVYG